MRARRRAQLPTIALATLSKLVVNQNSKWLGQVYDGGSFTVTQFDNALDGFEKIWPEGSEPPPRPRLAPQYGPEVK